MLMMSFTSGPEERDRTRRASNTDHLLAGGRAHDVIHNCTRDYRKKNKSSRLDLLKALKTPKAAQPDVGVCTIDYSSQCELQINNKNDN